MLRHVVTSCGTVLVAALLAASACSKESAPVSQAQADTPPAAQAAEAPASAGAATAQAGAIPGELFGDGVKESQAVAITDILASPDQYAGKTVRVEGTVTDVCPKRGCWFEMAGTKPGDKLRFKVQDGVMVFPMTAKGKYAVAEGVVVAQKLSLEETREYLEYQAREYGKEYDPASVTEPMTVVRLDGKGAVLRDTM